MGLEEEKEIEPEMLKKKIKEVKFDFEIITMWNFLFILKSRIK